MAPGIRLRGHHLLCLLGFRGMGYSEAFASNMKEVYETLRQQPTTIVTIVSGPDDLCRCFPNDQPNHCGSNSVFDRDELISRHIGLAAGDSLTWEQIIDRVRALVKPTHIPEWCSTCPWLSYGVCEEGIDHISGGGQLRELS